MNNEFLLVPMQLDAMVLNQQDKVSKPFLRFTMDYDQLQQFNSPEPPPFADTVHGQPEAGIYLHWTLPKALRHGVHKSDGTTEFPLIPNRWLVVRTSVTDRAVKAWLIESDYQGADASSPYVDPASLDALGRPKPTKIGRALRWPVAGTRLAAAPAKPFLKAVGPGSVTFSVYSPGIDNVLSFFDDLTADDDATSIDQGVFSYAVTGWFSEPTHDPINDARLEWVANPDQERPNSWVLQWKEEEEGGSTFDWYVYADSADLPRQSLLHALVSAVPWNRNAENPKSPNYPTDLANNVKVAVGNTSIDALAAIVRLDRSSQTEADLLEAFQYGLLETFDQPGSAEALNLAIRDHWFGGSSGGTLWTVTAAERIDDTTLPAPPMPVISEEQRQALAELNAQQYEQDRQQRILESMQWNLFSLWWKHNWQLHNTPPATDLNDWLAEQLPRQIGIGSQCAQDPVGTDPAAEPWYLCKVKAQQNLVAQRASDVESARAALHATLDAHELVLKPINMPQYRFPNDPVVLITGLGRSSNFDPPDGLLCRLPAQTVARLKIGTVEYCAGDGCARDIRSALPVLRDPRNQLPPAVQRLHVENAFLAPALLTALIGTPAADVSAALELLPRPGAQTQFAPPRFAWPSWVQPWVPLLLDWKVTVLRNPAYSAGVDQKNPHLMCAWHQEHWQFDGTDYTWAGPTEATGGNFDEGKTPLQLSGRTFITPHLTNTLATQLDAFVKTHQTRNPSIKSLLDDLDQYLQAISKQDILSQRLSGLMAMLVQRQFTQNVAPSGAIASAIGKVGSDASRDYRHGYPMPFANDRATYEPAVFDFAPLRGAFFVINGLTVIDSFGRSIDVMLGNHNEYPRARKHAPEYYFYPIAGRGLKSPTLKDPAPDQGESSDPTERMIQLTPAPVQDARLEFRLLSNDGKNLEIDRAAGTNPVCGWVVPNHLDRSVALYAPDGSAWGEVYLSKHARGHYVPSWQPDPTNPLAPLDLAAIPNVYARTLLTTLNARSDNGAGFYDFLHVIDETLWTINPRGQRQDQDLSVLVGRPLAIVRARLALQLRGLPYYSQDWWNAFAVDPAKQPDPARPARIGDYHGGVFDPLWPVRVGSNALRDDGLIGYFVDDAQGVAASFARFNTVNQPAVMRSDYLSPIDADNYIKLRFIDDTVARPDPARHQVCDITMLVDPRGKIHAFSGILPVVISEIPDEFVQPALDNMRFLFRAGPFLTAPNAIRIPLPAERQGSWGWFDRASNTTREIKAADDQVSLSTTPPLAREGWLKFTPNPPTEP